MNPLTSLTRSPGKATPGVSRLGSQPVHSQPKDLKFRPGETVELGSMDLKNQSLEILGGIAKRGEFWDCGGVKENHLAIIEKNLRPQESLLEATEAFADLFEVYKDKSAAPTTPTNLAWPKLAAMAGSGESMKSVVSSFADLVGFESERQLIDGARHGMRSMENIHAELKPGEDRRQAIQRFKQDPDAFFESGSEPTANPRVFGYVNHRNVADFSHHQISSTQVLAVLEESPSSV